MIYRTLGQSGLKVSALTLGTMMFGEQTNTEDSLRIIDKAWDQGINFIDTADVYTAGRSEELVGEAIARHRQDWVVASKVGFGPADGLPNRSGLSRKRIFTALEASLTRLEFLLGKQAPYLAVSLVNLPWRWRWSVRRLRCHWVCRWAPGWER